VGIKTVAQHKGYAAEEAVARHLIENGFKIIARNYIVFGGELDIVAIRSSLLVFVEVKYRCSVQMPIEYLIPSKKQRSVAFAARCFMAQYAQSAHMDCRFDVAIIVGAGARDQKLTYIPNAFCAQ